jgi:thiosulfate/3-mercaptopyruvate sulfurtransferase
MTLPTATTETRPTTQLDHLLVPASWLQTRIHDPRLRVIEVDVSTAAYDAGHIAGAVLWNVYRDFKTPTYEPIDLDTIRRRVEASGIDPSSTVVFYGYAPAMGAWLLSLLGHSDVRILDCPRQAWPNRGRAWSTDQPSRTTAVYSWPEALLEIRADLDDVVAAIDDASVTILDVRSAAEYAGEQFWPSGGSEPGGRSGHVPGAVRLPLESLVHDDGTFRAEPDLRRAVEALGIRDDAAIITYCTVGGRASTAWFALSRILGRPDVRVFDGSWAQWGLTPFTPVAST